MRRKIGTVLDERLYQRAKDAARSQGRSLNEVLAEALERFLSSHTTRPSVVAETRGTYKVSARALRAVLEEDPYDVG